MSDSTPELPERPEIEDRHIFGIPAPRPPRVQSHRSRDSGGGGEEKSNGSQVGNIPRRSYSPKSWESYFDSSAEVDLDSDIFQVYSAGKENADVVFVLLHGAGMTALSWSMVASQLKVIHRVISFDYRGHGNSRVQNETDLSMETLVDDVARVVSSLVDSATPIVLVGHSMGGALAVRVTASGKLPNVVGVVVIDVVEGTALAALSHMTGIIKNRPKSFVSLEQAVKWSVRAHYVRNSNSARVSVPPQFVLDDASNTYKWRTDLMSSKPYWEDWYKGLSEQFLGCRAAKMLMLAGTDRLDKPLTIGQMQGKFQMVVIPDTGHTVHEDSPHKVVEILLQFVVRNRFAQFAKMNAKLKKKKNTKS